MQFQQFSEYSGATTLSITTLNVTTFSFATNKKVTFNNTTLSKTTISIMKESCYSEFFTRKALYAECYYANYRNAESHEAYRTDRLTD